MIKLLLILVLIIGGVAWFAIDYTKPTYPSLQDCIAAQVRQDPSANPSTIIDQCSSYENVK